jgi:hypothetical protein
MITHLRKEDQKLYGEFWNLAEQYSIRLPNKKYTCLVCKKVMSKTHDKNILIHFMAQHIEG